MKDRSAERLLSIALNVGFPVLIAIALFWITYPFMEGLTWAIILASVTWPARQWLQKRSGCSDFYAALVMSIGLSALFLAAVVPGAIELGKELYVLSNSDRLNVEKLTATLASLPLIGTALESPQLGDFLKAALSRFGGVLLGLAGSATQLVIDSLFNLAVMLFSSYFMFRHGPRWLRDVSSVVTGFGGERWLNFFALAKKTISGVVYGAIITALAQGLLAGIGFHVAGAPIPALLGLTTMLISFVPFGAPLVYVPVSLYLIVLSGNILAGLGLFFWGVAVVSTIDNILRPVFISQAIRMPLLMIFIGIIGGIFAFGLLGLFLGPIVMAIVQVTWREFVAESHKLIMKRLEI